jgi:hypothetical protein
MHSRFDRRFCRLQSGRARRSAGIMAAAAKVVWRPTFFTKSTLKRDFITASIRTEDAPRLMPNLAG